MNEGLTYEELAEKFEARAEELERRAGIARLDGDPQHAEDLEVTAGDYREAASLLSLLSSRGEPAA